MAKTSPEAALAAAATEDLSLERLGAAIGERPLESAIALVAASAAIFYQAEKGKNPKCETYWDALVYCSTCISVGYGDIFARTPIGKIVGSVLMTVGPAIANKALDGPPRESTDAVQREILATLKQVLAELRAKKD
jgi:hypothetical protein